METPESKEKKTPNQVVVTPDIKNAIEDESVRLSRVEKKKVTQGEVVARTFRMYKDSLTPKLEAVIPGPIDRYTDTEREWLRDFMLTGMTALEIAKGVSFGQNAPHTGKHNIDSLIKAARAEEARTFPSSGKQKAAGAVNTPNPKRIGK